MAQLSPSELPSIPFSIFGLCCPNVEAWLFRNRCVAISLGCVLYLPPLFLLELLWFGSVVLTIIINVLVLVLCCNWKPHRKLLNIPEPRDIHECGVMLDTSTPLMVNATNKSEMEPDSVRLNVNPHRHRSEISILSFNVFQVTGRFWQRYPLLIRELTQHQADIVCIQECVTTNIWQFGTLQTLNRIDASYSSFSVNVRQMFYYYIPWLFRYAFLWPMISELQLILNAHFWMPFWKEMLWQAILGGSWLARYGFLMLTGMATQFGNAIAFGGDKELKYKSFIMLPGDRCAVRALYDMTAENGKKVWIVCTHLSCNEEQESFFASKEHDHDAGDQQTEERERSNIGVEQCEVIMKWMEDAQENIAETDYVIICGDFNASPKTRVYRYFVDNGYKSVVFEKLGYEEKTFMSGTWTCNELSDHNDKHCITLDYIWIKKCNADGDDEEFNVQIAECKLVGTDYVTTGEGVEIHASDHLGLYVKLIL